MQCRNSPGHAFESRGALLGPLQCISLCVSWLSSDTATLQVLLLPPVLPEDAQPGIPWRGRGGRGAGRGDEGDKDEEEDEEKHQEVPVLSLSGAFFMLTSITVVVAIASE